MKRLTITKRGWVTITAVIVILGITFSVLAETAGGVTAPTATDSATHRTTMAYTPPANPAGSVGLDTMGLGASLAAANYTTDPPAATTAAALSTSPVQSPSQPASTPPTTITPPKPVTPPTEPCKCPANASSQFRTICERYCAPTTPPVCQPCGGYRKLANGAAICPMYMCAYPN